MHFIPATILMKWFMKEYRQAQNSVQEGLLSSLAKVQLGQRDTLSSQKKLSTHCYLTKILSLNYQVQTKATSTL